jgi:hypothetical protein
MSNVVHRVPNDIPVRISVYWFNNILVPSSTNFYDFEISKVSINIFTHKHAIVDVNSHPLVFSLLNEAHVKLKGAGKTLRMGLHLFPIQRLKSKSIVKFTIKIIDKEGKKFPVNLPGRMNMNILALLNEGRPHRIFTCIQFIEFINDVYVHDQVPNWNRYIIKQWLPDQIKEGDAVLLNNAQRRPTHTALYIGRNLYLWLRGTQCFHVSTLESMLATYKSHPTYILTPR